MKRTVVVEPSEVRAVRLECECGREIVQPVRTGAAGIRVFDECPFCGANWKFHGEGDPVTALYDIKKVLEAAPAQASGVTISLVFEIEV